MTQQSRWEFPNFDQRIVTAQVNQDNKAIEDAKKAAQQEGLAKAQAEIQQMKNELNSQINALKNIHSEINLNIAQHITEVVSNIISKLSYSLVASDKERMQSLVCQIIKQFNTKNAKIELHAGHKIFEALKGFDDNKTLEIKLDNSMGDIDFKVNTEKQFANFNLNEIIAQFLNGDSKNA